MKITLRSHNVVTALLEAEDGRDRLIQTDWDAPGIARSFGWNIGEVGTGECPHESTDGTVTCKGCGKKAGDFITAALDWIQDNDGAEIEDPGYFD